MLYCSVPNISYGAQQNFNYRPFAASNHIRSLPNQLKPLLDFPKELPGQRSQVCIRTYPEEQEEQLKQVERPLAKSMVGISKLEHKGREFQYRSQNKELKQQQEKNRKSDSCETVLSANQQGNLENISQLIPITANNTQEDKIEKYQKICNIKIPEAFCSLSKLEAFHEQYRGLESGVIQYQSAIEAFQGLDHLGDYFVPKFDGTEKTNALKKLLKCQRSKILRLRQQLITICEANSEMKTFIRTMHENQVELCQKLLASLKK